MKTEDLLQGLFDCGGYAAGRQYLRDHAQALTADFVAALRAESFGFLEGPNAAPDLAPVFAQLAVVAATILDDDYEKGMSLYNRGSIYARLDQHAQAVALFREAQTWFRVGTHWHDLANCLFDAAISYHRLRELASAVELLGQALAHQESEEERARTLAYMLVLQKQRGLDEEALLSWFAGTMGAAATAEDEASAAGSEAPGIPDEGAQDEVARLYDVAQSHLDRGDAAQAKAVLENALALAQANYLLQAEALTRFHLGNLYSELACDYERARRHYEQARDLFEQSADGDGARAVANRLLQLDFITSPSETTVDPDSGLTVSEVTLEEELNQFTAGQFQTFTLEAYREQLRRAREQGDGELEYDSLRGLAALYNHLGDVQSAMAYSLQTMEMALAAGHPRYQAECQLALGNAYYRVGDLERAGEMFRRCLERAERLMHRRLQASALLGLGATATSYAEAIDGYRRAHRLFQEVQDERHAHLALTNMASAYLHAAQADEVADPGEMADGLRQVERLLQRAADSFAAQGATNEVAYVTLQTARLAAVRGDMVAASADLQQAYSLYQETNNEAGQIGALHTLAQIQRPANEQAALDALATAIKLVEARFYTIVPETIQLPFLGQSQRLYSDMVRWSSPADATSAFNYVERGRSRAFLDIIGGTEVPQPPAVAQSAAGSRETQLRQQLRELRLQIGRHADADGTATRLWQAYATLNEELDGILEMFDREQEEVAAYVDLRRGLPLTFGQIQMALSL